MGIIKILDNNIASKISAGEVVEGPASVVKELIENSIDAKAKNITLEIKNAGKKLIKITDDGCGMIKEDAIMSIARHATSKINTIEDIEKISTLGFRGEALASISAVSKMQIITKPKDQLYGTLVDVRGGDIKDIRETGCKDGTTVIVSDLFFNTPARLKFLKRDSTEFNHIYDIFIKLMLSHPDIAFKLINDDKLKIASNGDGNLLNCIRNIWGDEISKKMLNVNSIDINISVTGYISDNSVMRRNKNDILFYVNNRSVTNKALYASVLDVYKQYLTIGTYPIVVINIEIDPSKVDVNIHPIKSEIKFSDDHLVYSAIYNALNRTINPQQKSTEQDNTIKNLIYENRSVPINKETTDERNYPKNKSIPTAFFDNYFDNYMDVYDEENNIRYIGQVFDTFLLFEKANEIYLVDQHAAHERVLYEKYLDDFNSSHINSQRLLIPIIIELKLNEITAIKENQNSFTKIGYEIEDFGETSIAVRAIPVFFGQTEAKLFLNECIDFLLNSNTDRNKIDEMLFTKACKAAIKANDKVNANEAIELINTLLKCNNPYNCPHGRPTMIKYTKKDLEKLFKRIV